jgi:hypothetical protein
MHAAAVDQVLAGFQICLHCVAQSDLSSSGSHRESWSTTALLCLALTGETVITGSTAAARPPCSSSTWLRCSIRRCHTRLNTK